METGFLGLIVFVIAVGGIGYIVLRDTNFMARLRDRLRNVREDVEDSRTVESLKKRVRAVREDLED